MIRPITQAFPMRYFFRYELEHLLARSGFQITAAYSDYDRTPLGGKHPGELIFVARKAPGHPWTRGTRGL
jgi:hypothetical protein